MFAGVSEAENGVSVLSGCLLGFLKLRMGWGERNRHCCEWVFAGFSEAGNFRSWVWF